jgi:porphobilinogen synthase
MVRENHLSSADFIYPLFVHEGASNEPISAMPGCQRWSLDGLITEVGRAWELGIRCVVLFPKVADGLKTEDGSECFNEGGLIPRAIRRLKEVHPDMTLMTDVALDPYSCDGHDGLVSDTGVVLNDETVEILCRQAITQAQAGADLIGPSDMMDGRVGAIREALDAEGFEHVGIISYTAKYASAYYGPFREALDSAPRSSGNKPIPTNKSTYQMDPANSREALTEALLDEQEGADILMVKPGLAYLDIVHRLRAETELPIAAYNVSGEYSMVKAAAERGWIDERAVVLETLLCFKRAGANLILTYHACDAATWLSQG